jgi:hypothetical protein
MTDFIILAFVEQFFVVGVHQVVDDWVCNDNRQVREQRIDGKHD